MNRFVRNALAAAGFVAATLASNVALAVLETEGTPGANDTFATAQPLDGNVVGGTDPAGGTVEVTGAIGNTTCSARVVEDLDFYSFTATDQDVLTIDINGGIKNGICPSAQLRSVDTTIAIFDEAGNLLYANDDFPDVDMGSLAGNDSHIDFALLQGTGTYYVAVASSGSVARNFQSGGTLDSSTLDPDVGNGSYTLTISGMHTPQVTPPTGGTTPPDTTGGTGTTTPPDTTGGTGTTTPPDTTGGTGTTTPPDTTPPSGGPGPVVGGAVRVNIDIRPRHHGVAKIWANTDGKVVVALLSSKTFNPMRVDRSSLRFGADGTERSLLRCNSEGVYVNRDRKKDLVCLFDLKTAGFEVGDIEGVLTGTVDGQRFEGHAPLKVYQRGKKHKHREALERHANRR